MALHIGVRLAVWLRPLRELDDLVLPDDSYLSLHLARSIAQGKGPFYGLAPTNGFQPLYVFLMAPVFALTGGDLDLPVRIALALLVVADALAMFFTLRVALRLGCSTEAVVVGGLLWGLSPWSLHTSLNGLETSIAAACIAATLWQWHRVRAAQPGLTGQSGVAGWMALGALGGLACLARVDSVFLGAALGVPLLLAVARPRIGGPSDPERQAMLRGLGIAAIAACLAVLPWIVYSAWWTQDVFPTSGRAVRYLKLSAVNHAPTLANTYAPMLVRAARALAHNAGPATVLALGLALAAWIATRGKQPSHVGWRLAALLPIIAFGAMLVAAYTLYIFGPWYFGRYFYPLWIPAVLAVAITADALFKAFSGARARAVCVAVVAGVVIVGSIADPQTRVLFAQGAPAPWGYRRAGEWARDHFPPGTIIGSSQSGALGYFAERLTVVNLDGVVNRDCYEAMRRGEMLEYIRHAGVRTLLWQDDIQMIGRETKAYDQDAVRYSGEVPGIMTEGSPWFIYKVEAGAGAPANGARAPRGTAK